jgi:hypothetical protein
LCAFLISTMRATHIAHRTLLDFISRNTWWEARFMEISLIFYHFIPLMSKTSHTNQQKAKITALSSTGNTVFTLQ